MKEAMQTLTQFSTDAIGLYEQKKQLAKDPAAKDCFEMAIENELRLRQGVSSAIGELSEKQDSAMFKWHDRQQLMQTVPSLQDARVDDPDDALQVVKTCEDAARAYCEGLQASTNSQEMLQLLSGLVAERKQALQKLSWQLNRDRDLSSN